MTISGHLFPKMSNTAAAYHWYVLVFVCCHSNNLINFNLIPNKLRATEKRSLQQFDCIAIPPPQVTAVCSDCIDHITSQPNCREVHRSRMHDCCWHAGLSTNVDQTILSSEIVAYKIQWFNGHWSGWYVPGVNDIDTKYNTRARTCSVPPRAHSLRRVWSYFYDHTHMYIIRGQNSFLFSRFVTVVCVCVCTKCLGLVVTNFFTRTFGTSE